MCWWVEGCGVCVVCGCVWLCVLCMLCVFVCVLVCSCVGVCVCPLAGFLLQIQIWTFAAQNSVMIMMCGPTLNTSMFEVVCGYMHIHKHRLHQFGPVCLHAS